MKFIGKISIYSDIFSLGHLYYEIIANNNPFYEITYDKVENEVINGKYLERVNPKNSNDILYSDDMWNLLLKTWAYDNDVSISSLLLKFLISMTH